MSRQVFGWDNVALLKGDNGHAVQFVPAPVRKRPVQRHAAGILFKYTDDEGSWYFLTKRADWLSSAGQWAVPGGSLNYRGTRLEDPLSGAFREFVEETGVHPSDVEGAQVIYEYRYISDEIIYDTFVVEVPVDFEMIEDRSETADAAWVHGDDLHRFRLHKAFREMWEAYQEELTLSN